MKSTALPLAAIRLAAPARAEHPERANQITIPTPASGGKDISARKPGTLLEEELGTSIAILNLAGGGGFMGVT